MATSRQSEPLVSRRVGDAQSAVVAMNFEGFNLVRRQGGRWRPIPHSNAVGGDFDRVSGARRASIPGELDLGRSTVLGSTIRDVYAELETFLGNSENIAEAALGLAAQRVPTYIRVVGL